MHCRSVFDSLRAKIIGVAKKSEKVDKEIMFYIVADDKGNYRIENLSTGTECRVVPEYPNPGPGEEVVAAVHTHPGETKLFFSAGDVADPDITQCLIIPKTGEMKCVRWKGESKEYPRDIASKETEMLKELCDIYDAWAEFEVTDEDVKRVEERHVEFGRFIQNFIDVEYETVCHEKSIFEGK